jgi:hypothetical protein
MDNTHHIITLPRNVVSTGRLLLIMRLPRRKTRRIKLGIAPSKWSAL